jgi:hypothetical protein
MPVHAIVTISVPSSLFPQDTITAGMGASRVEGGILIFDIDKTFFRNYIFSVIFDWTNFTMMLFIN